MVARSDDRELNEGYSPDVIRNIRKSVVQFSPVFTDENADEPPELFLMNQMASRPRAMSHHLSSAKIPSRRWLASKARFWRSLMTFGMLFHDFAPPKPPKPSFKRQIATDTVPIDLLFYLPADFKTRINYMPTHRYPVVVNFHGGGFCLGHATDDRYWARVIVAKTPAIFVSVGYRRAPEHPFPQPVDDCVEALLYLQSHAEELHIDPGKVALSGFSAGANLAFTVPFRLTYQYEKMGSKEHLPERINDSVWAPTPTPSEPASPDSPILQQLPQLNLQTDGSPDSPVDIDNESPNLSRTSTNQQSGPQSLRAPNVMHKSNSSGLLRQATTTNAQTHGNLLDVPGPRSKLLRTLTQESLQRGQPHESGEKLPSPGNQLSRTSTSTGMDGVSSRLRIVSILAWYPLLDWTSSRQQKVRGSRNPKKTLPKVFTDLFDFSYLPAPDVQGHHCSPYASPALAPNHMIRDGLPHRIQMWLCEWDMLLAEGELFSSRLTELGKDCRSEVIPGVPHAWDKSPNPLRDQRKIDALYERAAGYLTGVFGEADRRNTVGEGIGLGGMR